jgi:HK97 family phage major capsid protein
MKPDQIKKIAGDMGLAMDDSKAQTISEAVSKFTGAERSVELAKQFATLQGATVGGKQADDARGEGMAIQFTDSQVDKLIQAGALGMTKQVEEIVAKVAQKFGTTVSDVRAQAGNIKESRMQQAMAVMKENKVAANCLQSLYLLKTQQGDFDDVRRAFHQEAEFLGRDTMFTLNEKQEKDRVKQAMGVGTDSTGGYLSPEIFSTRVYEKLEKYGVARQFATLVPMEGEIMRIPTLDTDLTAADTAEAAQATASDIAVGQKVLQPRKQVVLAGPFSDELLINAEPGIIGILQESAGRALAKLEDNHVFIGTSGSFTGLLELTAKVLTLAAGVDITTMDIDDVIDLIGTLDDRYVTEEARCFWNKAVTTTLRKAKVDATYAWGNVTNPRERELLGYGYTHVTDMTSSPALGAAFGVFGDLSNVWIGLRGGLRIDLLTEGTVNSVNLGETSQYALRVIEYMDSEVIDTSAFAVLKRNAA